MSALRFFGLIDENQNVRDEFRAVVEAARVGEAEYKDKMVQVVCDAYDPIVGAEFDLQAGTLPDLERKFRDAGVPQGQMVTKATRFYLNALKDAGIKVSEHITKPRRRTTKPKGTKQPKKVNPAAEGKDAGGAGAGAQSEQRDVLPPNFERQTIPGMAGAYIQFPASITESQCELLDSVVGLIRTYAKLRDGSEGKKK